MLHLIPARLHRLLYRAAHGVRKLWWRVYKAPRSGVTVLGFNAAGEILLLRQSYGGLGWVAPSGGVERGEEPLAAALRECAEETGLVLEETVLAGVSEESIYGAPHRVYVYTGKLNGTPQVDGREIVAAQFFSLQHLPNHLPKRLRERLKLAGIAYNSDS